jgi:2-isopropylmalate synthase
VLLELDGVLASGQGVSTDILEASGRAYLRALSNAIAARARRSEAQPEAVAAPTP